MQESEKFKVPVDGAKQHEDFTNEFSSNNEKNNIEKELESLVDAMPNTYEIDDILQDSGVPEEARVQILAKVAEYHAGPLPAPRTLKEYSEIPGVVETIIGMANSEMNHRHTIEDRMTSVDADFARSQMNYVSSSIDLKKRKQLFGFIITILFVAFAFVSLLLDKNIASVVAFVGALGGFVTVMFNGKEKKEDDSLAADMHNDSEGEQGK